MVELFYGQGELTRQCRKAGFDCRGMDISKNPLHDLTTPEGLLECILNFGINHDPMCTEMLLRFLLALTKVLRIRPSGLFWSGNPCNR